MESSLIRLMWLACYKDGSSCRGVTHLQPMCAKVYNFVPYSGHLGSPAGRSSVVVKPPTLEWTLSP